MDQRCLVPACLGSVTSPVRDLKVWYLIEGAVILDQNRARSQDVRGNEQVERCERLPGTVQGRTETLDRVSSFGRNRFVRKPGS